MLKVINLLSDLFTVIIALPLAILCVIGLFSFWLVKLPFWYLLRLMRK